MTLISITHHALEQKSLCHRLLLGCWLSSCTCLRSPAEREKGFFFLGALYDEKLKWDLNRKRLTCVEATRSTSPPRRRRWLLVSRSGRPSFSHVRVGVGIPAASHSSSMTLLTTTDTSFGEPELLMCGGSDENEVKHLFPSATNQKLKM